MVDRQAERRGLRTLWISILIFGVVHIPLPQADYHNIRHHDGPGEVCPYHDHLLRWHPSATFDADVSILHWHWFVPQGELGDPQHGTDDADGGPVSIPLVHAHLANGLVPDWPDELVTQLVGRSRLPDHLVLAAANGPWAVDAGVIEAVDPSSRRVCAEGLNGCDGLRAARCAMFQRWNC